MEVFFHILHGRKHGQARNILPVAMIHIKVAKKAVADLLG